MNSTKFKGMSLLVALALLLSTLAVVAPAPVKAAISTVSITWPTQAEPGYAYTGGTETVTFSATSDAAGLSDIKIEVRLSGSATWTTAYSGQATLNEGVNAGLNADAVLSGTAGWYDLRVQVRQPAMSGTWVESGIELNAILVDNTIPTVTLTNPNGGNFISANQDYTVYFNVTDAIPNVATVTVSAKYSTDAGGTYPYPAFEAKVSKGAGSAVWPKENMPAFDTNTARLQLTVTDEAGNSKVVTSASNFTIIKTLPTLVIQQPTATSIWNGASSQTIQFTTTTGLSVSQDYKIEYSNDNFATSIVVRDFGTTTPSLTPGLTNYTWVVDNTYRGTNAKIRVTPKDKALNEGSAVTSDAFTIVDVTAPTVTVSAPLAGTKFYSEVTATGTDTNPIWSWTGTDNVITLPVGGAQTLTYNIYLSTDGGTNYTLLDTRAGQPQGINKELTWTPPAIAASSTNCKIKITATDAAPVPNTSPTGGISPTFSILKAGTISVAVTSPNTSSVSWQQGTAQSITWTASDSSDTAARLNYEIQLSQNGGGTYTTIATITNQPTGSRTYSWAVAGNACATNRIKIIATNPASGASNNDASDANFTITAADFDVQTCNITLKQGWNLISLPLVPTNPNIENILSTCIGRIDRVWGCTGNASVAANWKSYYPGGPTGLTTMVDGQGYWIKVTPGDDTWFVFQGRYNNAPPSAPQAYSVVTGWNLIGYKAVATHTVADYLGATNYNVPVIRFDNTGLTSGNYVSQFGTDNMVSKKGYFVYFNAAGVISPPSD